MEFKDYLLNEQKEYLAQRIGAILNMVHELLRAQKQIGARQLLKRCEYIVDQIRKVLHTSWTRSERKYLLVLQKCGVAVMRAIDEKNDLLEIMNAVRAEIEHMTSKLGMPINSLGSEQKA